MPATSPPTCGAGARSWSCPRTSGCSPRSPAAGARPRGARPASPSSAQLAIAALLGPYSGPSSYYTRKYPSLTSRPLPTRALTLALTDTFARTAVETYATIARRYGVYLEAGVDMARSWRIVCADRSTYVPPPGGGPCTEVNPAKVRALGDPDEPDRTYAYEATTSRTANMALVFSPAGRLIAKVAKAYPTPIELPDTLDLVPGDVDGVRAVRTKVGTLGFVTSKDAWMPDVTAKLDARGVDLLVQPEFFVGDTLSTHGMWAADTLKAAGYADVLRHPSFQAYALPSLTGNLFSLPADAQAQIGIKPRGRSTPRGHLAGQPDAPGLATVAPYSIRDPQRPGESYATRRARLGRAGEAMLAGGPACANPRVAGPCANGMREGTVWRDVTVDRRPRLHRVARRRYGRTPFSVSRPLSRSARPQRNVDLAARGSLVAAAFEESGHPVVVASLDGGRTWGPRAYPAGRRVVHGWWPQVAIGPDRRVWATWQRDAGHTPRVYVANSGAVPHVAACRPPCRRRILELGFSHPRAVAPAAAPQWRPTIAAPARKRAVVAWIDERERSADDALPQAHLYSARVGLGATGAVRRLDTAPPVADAAKLDHAWAPDLVARGRVLLLDVGRLPHLRLARVVAPIDRRRHELGCRDEGDRHAGRPRGARRHAARRAAPVRARSSRGRTSASATPTARRTRSTTSTPPGRARPTTASTRRARCSRWPSRRASRPTAATPSWPGRTWPPGRAGSCWPGSTAAAR